MNEEEKKLYEEFQDKFPIDKLDEMTLETYTAISKEGFSFWILDDIFGTTNYKTYKINLGIYKYEKNPKFGNTKNTPHGFDDTYAWQYDTNRDRAFRIIKNRIIETATNAKNYSQNQDKQYLKNIDKIDLPPVYKWKIAFLYSDRELINCYSVDKLKELLKNLQPNAKTSIPISDLQFQLVNIKKENPTKFNEAFDSLWSKDNNNKNKEDKTITNTTTSELAQECAKLLINTKNLILHGAPGTGKTYLAKNEIVPELAKLLGVNKDDVEIGLVQFHPSYDYTDFVEGIRPTRDEKFEPVDGIFKKFCEKAINNSEHILKTSTDVNTSYFNILEILKDFVSKFENKIPKHWSKSMEFFKNKLKTLESSTNNINQVKELFYLKIELLWFSEECSKELRSNDKLKTTSLMIDKKSFEESLKNLKDKLLNYLNSLNYRNDLNTCWNLLMQEVSKHNINNPLKIYDYYFIKAKRAQSLKKVRKENDGYKDINTTFPLKNINNVYKGNSKGRPYNSIIEYMSTHYKLKTYANEQLEDHVFDEPPEEAPNHSVNKNPFIFIIDEINRGELSKIFGELFFSIDPEYRGTKGAILTQYANMQDKQNKFDEALGITDSDNFGHFFVPENVYIIGTMNDIDRSVESMDLAMRRRFTFKEIKATDTQDSILSQLDTTIDNNTAKKRMETLNKAIWDDDTKTGELSSSDYHIGAAYFLKLNNFEGTSEEKFQKLWEYNLKPLLHEYLRDKSDIENKLNKLEEAYKNQSEPKEKADEQ